jgi:hypothetical protein
MNDEAHSRAELFRRAAALALGLAAARAELPRLLGGGIARAAAPLAPTLVTREEPVGGGRTPLGIRPAPQFTLVGLHWQGPGSVRLRARRADGTWSPWYRSVVHEQADPAEGGVEGWHLGTPVWTGPSTAIQYELEGRVTRLRAHFVDSPTRAERRPAATTTPTIVARADWGADESIVRAAPSYASRLQLAIVHHTAGSTPKSPDQSAAIVRAIQVYHVKSNGWNDIGYNFLVDPFGQVFEGRGGGIDRNVIGAHALGFNTGSTGVSLLGNFETKTLTDEARAALVGLLAWRLDVGHVDPTAQVRYVSSGVPHTLRAVSGHRDVNSTDCPGGNLYPELDGIAADALALGLPKLFEPLAARTTKGGVRFTARLSHELPWQVEVSSGKTAPVASGAGTGQQVDWTWLPPQPASGTFSWSIASVPDVRPATGKLTLGGGDTPPPVEPPPRPERPDGLPRRIPGWAWELRRWHLAPGGQRGPRPASAPRHLPPWYWPWFRWQNALKDWEAQYGA